MPSFRTTGVPNVARTPFTVKLVTVRGFGPKSESISLDNNPFAAVTVKVVLYGVVPLSTMATGNSFKIIKTSVGWQLHDVNSILAIILLKPHGGAVKLTAAVLEAPGAIVALKLAVWIIGPVIKPAASAQ